MDVQRRNVLFVAIDGAIIGLMSAAGTFVSVFVIRLGASALWVSLLSSIPSAIRLVMAIPWSRYAERQTRPQVVFSRARLAVHVVYPLVAVLPFFLPDAWIARAVVLTWALTAFPGSLSNIMFTVVMGHSVPPQRRAFLMSRRWMVMGIAKLISLPLASQLIERLVFPVGYQIVFGVNFVLALGAFYCAAQLCTQERQAQPTQRDQPIVQRVRASLSEVLRARSFVAFVGGRALFNLGLALVSAMIPIYWVNHLHAGESWIGYFTATLSAATLVSYAPWVRIKRKWGTWKTLIASVLVSALYPALLALTRSPVAVLPVIALNGLAAGGMNLAFFDALFETCPSEREERYVAINTTAINLMGVIGPPIAAALLLFLSIRWVLALGTLVALLGVAVFALASLRPRPPRSARRAPSSRTITGEPVGAQEQKQVQS